MRNLVPINKRLRRVSLIQAKPTAAREGLYWLRESGSVPQPMAEVRVIEIWLDSVRGGKTTLFTYPT
ncbi:hypothetical protein VNO77_02768 [Canavalia gladiata]|uniref:Uncharacterized protein n=1 Tax=Canavalia gladiata TaxID=3824 RepID=A0AAN9N027_CANGL